MVHIRHVAIAPELPKRLTRRRAAIIFQTGEAGFLQKLFDDFRAEAFLDAPCIAVEPCTVKAVFPGQLFELRNQLLVDIGGIWLHDIGIRRAVLLDDAPFRVLFAGARVPDAGVMRNHENAALGRFFA